MRSIHFTSDPISARSQTLLADSIVASGRNRAQESRERVSVKLPPGLVIGLTAVSGSAPDGIASALVAAALIVADRISGAGSSDIGFVLPAADERDDATLLFGEIRIRGELKLRDWILEIDQTLDQWRSAAHNRELGQLQRPEQRPEQIEEQEQSSLLPELAIMQWLPPSEAAQAEERSMPPVLIGCTLQRASISAETVTELAIDYDPGFIAPSLASAFLLRTLAILESLAGSSDQPVRSLTLADPDDFAKQPAPGPTSPAYDGVADVAVDVPTCFDRQCALHPQAQALAWDGGSLSYLELQARSIDLCQRLRAEGVTANDVVATVFERGPDVYPVFLALLRLGASYLPIDPSWPSARIRFMLQQAKARTLIKTASVDTREWFDTREIERADSRIGDQSSWGDIKVIDLAKLKVIDLAKLSTTTAEIAPPASRYPDATAYIMYTSGSTGNPKGVMISQRAILRLVKNAAYMRLDPTIRMLQAAPLGFDASTLEIWGPLLNGGCCIVHSEAIPTARGLARTIREHRVDSAWLTAALFNTVVDQGAEPLHGLKQLAIGGEALSVAHVRRALEACPELRLINGYGPTECTTFSTTYEIPRGLPANLGSIPIGFPITDTYVRILNQRLEAVPAGFIGELYIGGTGLASGYVGDSAMTAQRFIEDPYAAPVRHPTQTARLYRSGDRVRLLADGAIEFIGRADAQIKLRGHRIEPGEIEAVLQSLPGVLGCVIMVRHEVDPDGQLVAYVQASAGEYDPTAWRNGLRQQLPEPMIPAVWIQIDSVPLTANGKLDRKALPAPLANRPRADESFEPPADELESGIAEVFSEILGVKPIGALDNFFEFGGSSLAVLRAAALLEERIKRDVSVASFFGDPTPRGVARLLRSQLPAASDSTASGSQNNPHFSQGNSLNEPIAIIGMAVRLPGANSLDAFWQNLVSGRDSISRFSSEQLDPSISQILRQDKDYVAARGVIEGAADFDPGLFGISPLEAELMDPQQRVFLELCWECMEHAGQAPGAHPSNTGVFAGVYNASYYQNHVLAHPEKIEALGAFQVMLANEKDYVATRVAHRLNLTGPAVNVFTACSTSLVAVAQAIDSLRLGHCSSALAGGASITCPPNSGYLYQEGSMLSSNGETRTFDAQAAGTVFSDGAAVVMLKRLSDAIADGNTIHALIRGAAINNDGSAKASFTAPSIDGQIAVVRDAQRNAGVEPTQVSYIEAHGTATPIGDPIEVSALTRAFQHPSTPNGSRDARCLIGSVKSNIGHTVMAAGAAGIIKTVLAMKHQLIPASIHYSKPNPELRLDDSPFEVVSQNTAWPKSTTPRIAGVSSFGVGGTNAHLILQDAPETGSTSTESSNIAAQASILRVSARTPSALAKSAANLTEFLRARPEIHLSDVAFTLEHGRKQFNHRLAVVADNPADALAALEHSDSTARVAGTVLPALKSTLMMFPGQGSQYAAMGSSLYRSEPVFAAALDQCFAILQQRLGFDLKTPLFELDPSALAATAITQPALFAIEYAIAQTWLSRGVLPTALIGHSVGEFVAATLAGVMSLEDGVVLVARRGALMQALPPGQMLAVRLGLKQVQAELPESLSIAAENSPVSVVVAGPAADITQYREQLEQRGVVSKLLQTSHAFHSAMMQPAVAEFEKELRKVELHEPAIPIMSTVTANWLGKDEATRTSYWAQHLRLPVLFSSALARVLATGDQLIIEAGPRASLGGLVRQQGNSTKSSVIVTSLADEPEQEQASYALACAKLWTVGHPAFSGVSGKNSEALRQQSTERRAGERLIPIPTYPFEHRRYWLDPKPVAPAAADAPMISPMSTTDMTSKDNIDIPVSRQVRLVQELGQLFESVSGIEMGDADPQARFTELGLDSLTLTQVALQIKRKFSINVSFRQLMQSHRTLNALAEHLDQNLPADQPTAQAPKQPQAPNQHQASTQTQVQLQPQTTVHAQSTGRPLAHSVPAANVASLAGNIDPGLGAVLHQQLLVMRQQLEILGLSSASPALPADPAFEASSPTAVSDTAAPSPSASSSSASSSSVSPLSDQAGTRAGARAADDSEEPRSIQSYDVKKAFGAIARIHTSRTEELTQRQRSRLDALIARYVERTKASKAYTTEHRDHLADPRVVNGFRPALKEIIYQIVIDRSSGPYVWDLDGNRYVDALNGFGMSLFGWQPQFITKALHQQLDAGYEIGPQHHLAGKVARQICALTGFDRAAFCNTGSEAVMGAIRIARTVTGRPLIVSFAGAYHGIFDEVVVRGSKSLRTLPAAPGIMANAGENVLVLEYGSEEALRLIEERSDEIAAVLVEPVQSRRPDFQPKEFLSSLRKLTEKTGIALVFDEVVTGFRAHPGGVQAMFGIKADLATYGKVIGGGLPIGVVAGKREFMDALDGGDWKFGDDSIPTVGVTYFAGTFVRHPLALAAAQAVLQHLVEQGPELQQGLNQRTRSMCEAMNEFCRSRSAPIEIRYFASVWRVVFLEDHVFQDLLFAMMRSRGIHILDNFPCFMTTAHGEEDIALMLEAFKDSVIELQEANFIPGRPVETARTFDANSPPVPGARLGRNRQGQIAWFVESSERSGKYVEMKSE